jgi:hypothetical protein
MPGLVLTQQQQDLAVAPDRIHKLKLAVAYYNTAFPNAPLTSQWKLEAYDELNFISRGLHTNANVLQHLRAFPATFLPLATPQMVGLLIVVARRLTDLTLADTRRSES